MSYQTTIERLSYSIEEFMLATGYSRRKTYAAIASGDLPPSFAPGQNR